MPVPRHPRLFLPFAIALVTVAVLLASPPVAGAGSYTAAQCNPDLGAERADVFWATNTTRYLRDADCSAIGMVVRHDGRRATTAARRYGAWTLNAPAGTDITRVSAGVGADGRAGHIPQVLIGLAGGGTKALTGVAGRPHRVGWTGDTGRAFTARLTCARQRGCGAGPGARLALRRIAVTLRDAVDPAVGLTGSLLSSGSRRGSESLTVNAQDAGSGVRSIVAEVNGEPVTARSQPCAIERGVAIRLRPCPGTSVDVLEFDTAAPAFRQGPNSVRVCAADHATTQDANRTCVARTIRIDNLCPVSATEGAVLAVRFAGGATKREGSSRTTSVVTGSVRDAAGRPLAGARVCVASRVRDDISPERVIATPLTDGDGSFRATLPAGPNREVRVAHWAGPERVHERYLDLRSRVVPQLRLRPRRMRNGERLRFAVRVPGPASQGRRVLVQARGEGRWITVDEGTTRPGGGFGGSYRFRSTTGTQRYAFRAVVPRQAGYPYLQGRSRTRWASVSG